MSKLPRDLQQLSANLPPDKAADIEAAIASSPYLVQQIQKAVREDLIDHVRLDVPNANRGGYYDASSKSIYLSADIFDDPQLKQNETKKLDKITGTLGHEVGHAFQAKDNLKSAYELSYQIQQKVRNPDYVGTADMTDIVGVYIKTARKHEAEAEMAGWNAVASRVMNITAGKATRDNLLERVEPTTSCVEGEDKNFRLGKGIILGEDFQLSDTRLPKVGPINREPVAACYFDQKPSDANLGKEGKSDYTNYYGTLAFEVMKSTLDRVSPKPLVSVDMAKLKLKPELLESNGLDLNGGTLSLLDSSPGKSRAITLHHTGSGNPNAPKAELDEPIIAKGHQINEPGHDGFRYFERSLYLIENSKEIPSGSLTKEQQHNLAAYAAANAIKEDHNFSGFDHAVKSKPDAITGESKTLFLVQRGMTDPAHHREGVNIAQAIATPIAQSTEVMNTALTTQQQLQQQQTLELQQTQSQQTGPVMRMQLPGAPGSSSGGGSEGGGGE